jgi:hypothetical protein
LERQGEYSYLDPGAGAVEQEAALVGLEVVPAVARPALGLLVDLEACRPELLAVLLAITTAVITAVATAAAAGVVVGKSSASVATVVTRSVGVCGVAEGRGCHWCFALEEESGWVAYR